MNDKYLCIKHLFTTDDIISDYEYMATNPLFSKGCFYERRKNKFDGTESQYFILVNNNSNRHKIYYNGWAKYFLSPEQIRRKKISNLIK